MTTLASIRTKVRRLTGRPSTQQITDAQIDDYVNTFYLYDLPEHLRLFHLHTTFEFMTEAYVDTYDLSTMQVSDGIGGTDNADNIYYNLQPPAYVAGYQSFYSQSPEQFYRTYPPLAQISTTVSGDGTVGPYTYTFESYPILQNSLTIGAVDSTGATVQLVDLPTNATTGTLQVINLGTAVTGSVNYVTGAVSVTFNNTIPSGNDITFTSTPYQPSRPQAVLYYADKIVLRPVPDAPYKVSLQAWKLPTALISSGESPELKQWWQYLAYGAAKKIFEDSQDPEGAGVIMQEFKEQQAMVERRAIVQYTNERTATIYTEMTGFPYGNFNNRF